ncbi:MAG: alpha/beta hydrolase [Myxococcus sp.]|nr:alpha/beta hydrolase [Myxococcus sp.]
MVMKGQFLERPTLIPLANALVLEGVSHRGERRPGVLVLPPPPAEGGGMDHVVGAEIAFAVSQAGYQCLRFNFRGVGASQGKPSNDEADLLEDALAAWELARDNAGGVAPLVVSIGSSAQLARRLTERVAVSGLAMVHPGASPFVPPVPHLVVLPELEGSAARKAWAALLDAEALSIVMGADRGYHRNLPQVGKALVALLRQVEASTWNP